MSNERPPAPLPAALGGRHTPKLIGVVSVEGRYRLVAPAAPPGWWQCEQLPSSQARARFSTGSAPYGSGSAARWSAGGGAVANMPSAAKWSIWFSVPDG